MHLEKELYIIRCIMGNKNIKKTDVNSKKTNNIIMKTETSNKKGKVKKIWEKRIIIFLSIMVLLMLLLVIGKFISYNKIDNKINNIVKLETDVIELESIYINVEKLTNDINKLSSENDSYNKQISNIKRDIEKINEDLIKLKASK